MEQTSQLMEQILSNKNLNKALRHVVYKNTSQGADNLCAKELPAFWNENSEKIKLLLRQGSYIPVPAKRIYIHKGNGKDRSLAIPSVVDRMIQTAFLYKLQTIYEPFFHKNSFGFRKNHSSLNAIRKCLKYINQGYTTVTNIDIEGFFDNVNHKKLLSIIKKQIKEPDVFRIIKKYICSDIVDGLICRKSHRGIIQGSALSPLLANIFLNELDWFMDRENILFIRYADDIIVFCKNKSEAANVLKKICEYLHNELSLNINREKTNITAPEGAQYLGYSFKKDTNGQYELSISEKVQQKLLSKMDKHIQCYGPDKTEWWNRLGCIHRGWINYYQQVNRQTMQSFLSDAEKTEFQKIHSKIFKNEFSHNCWAHILEADNYISLTQWYLALLGNCETNTKFTCKKEKFSF